MARPWIVACSTSLMDLAVDQLQRASAGRADVVSLAGGLPDPEQFPRTALQAAFARALTGADGCAALQYDWPEGNTGLRAWIATRLAARGVDVTPGDVIVTSGAQQALAIATALLAQHDALVETDDLAYPAALDLFRAASVRLVASAPPGQAAFAYVMSGVSNPGGIDVRSAHRDRLLASGTTIVADEAYAELRFDGETPPPFAAVARDRTWHVGSFSKTLCPGLRVGFLVPPRRFRDAALAVKQDADLQSGTLAQSVLAQFLAVDDYDARLARSRHVYRERADALLAALRRALPACRISEPEGGFSIWVEADETGDDVALLRCALLHGVSFDPGHLFARSPVPGGLAFRVCYSSAPIDRLAVGAARLARALESYRRAPNGGTTR